MKPLLLLLALGILPAHATSLEIVRSLANRPVALVEGDVCHVRGAVWADGPQADIRVVLIDVVSMQAFAAATDQRGVYSLEIPYEKPAVYQERLVDEVIVPEEQLARLRIHEGGVVCDHRLVQLSTPRMSE